MQHLLDTRAWPYEDQSNQHNHTIAVQIPVMTEVVAEDGVHQTVTDVTDDDKKGDAHTETRDHNEEGAHLADEPTAHILENLVVRVHVIQVWAQADSVHGGQWEQDYDQLDQGGGQNAAQLMVQLWVGEHCTTQGSVGDQDRTGQPWYTYKI